MIQIILHNIITNEKSILFQGDDKDAKHMTTSLKLFYKSKPFLKIYKRRKK